MILVNGSPTKEFSVSEGLRQGDPLASFLFNIFAEGLTGLMREALRKNMLASLLVWENEVPVNLLQYADNTIFIGEASLQNVITIKSLRTCFELVSGIQVNFNKSGFGTIGVDKVVTERYANLLNCRVMHVPFVYLGIPIGANPRIADTWSPVIFKLAKKLGAGGEAQIIVFLQGGCV